jgi:glycolate oxidase
VTPAPEHVLTLVAFFEHTAQAGEAVTAIVSAGIVPGAIEMMDRLSIQAAEAATGAGYRLDAGAALTVELDGPELECSARFDQVRDMCAQARARDIRIAGSEAKRALIWRTRKAAFAAMGRVAPACYVQDGVIPRTRLAEVLGRIDELASEYQLQVANVFHAGDGNLHPLVRYDAGRPGQPERAEELAALIVKACVDAGGSITGEHGAGADKKAHMSPSCSTPRPSTGPRSIPGVPPPAPRSG